MAAETKEILGESVPWQKIVGLAWGFEPSHRPFARVRSRLRLDTIGRSKLLAPLENRFVGDRDATVGKQFFDLSEPEAEPMVQPDGVTDDLRWKMKIAVAGRFGIHHTSLSNPGQLDNKILIGDTSPSVFVEATNVFNRVKSGNRHGWIPNPTDRQNTNIGRLEGLATTPRTVQFGFKYKF